MLLKAFLMLFLVCFTVTPSVTLDRQTNCMAQNVFYEAGSESFKGKLAVAYVTHNRTKNNHFPKEICAVVYQRNQFSWTTNKQYQKRHKITDRDWRWAQSVNVALSYDEYQDPTNGSLFFHEKNKNPRWRMKIKRTVNIGNHIFYKF